MTVKIIIPSYLQSFAENKETIEVQGSTVGECFEDLIRQFPAFRQKLFVQDEELLDYVTVFINRKDAYPNELAKPVRDGDEIHILYVIGGG